MTYITECRQTKAILYEGVTLVQRAMLKAMFKDTVSNNTEP